MRTRALGLISKASLLLLAVMLGMPTVAAQNPSPGGRTDTPTRKYKPDVETVRSRPGVPGRAKAEALVASESKPSKDSEGFAALRLDHLLHSHGLAADVFVADVDGNGALDFVVVHVGGKGLIVTRLPATMNNPEIRKSVTAAEFFQTTLGGVYRMQKDHLAWAIDKVFIVTSHGMRIVSSKMISDCSAFEEHSKDLIACLTRAYGSAPEAPADEAIFAKILRSPLPPNGFTERRQRGEATALMPVRTEGPGAHYYLTLANSSDNAVVATIFIRSGEGVMAKLPAGTYKAIYAAGQTWQGPEELFGPSSKCFAFAQVMEMHKEQTRAPLMLRTEPDETVRAVPCRE